MTIASSEFDHAERWHQWQRKNAEISRKSDLQVRAMFAMMFVVVGVRLAYQLLSR